MNNNISPNIKQTSAKDDKQIFWRKHINKLITGLVFLLLSILGYWAKDNFDSKKDKSQKKGPNSNSGIIINNKDSSKSNNTINQFNQTNSGNGNINNEIFSGDKKTTNINNNFNYPNKEEFPLLDLDDGLNPQFYRINDKTFGFNVNIRNVKSEIAYNMRNYLSVINYHGNKYLHVLDTQVNNFFNESQIIDQNKPLALMYSLNIDYTNMPFPDTTFLYQKITYTDKNNKPQKPLRSIFLLTPDRIGMFLFEVDSRNYSRVKNLLINKGLW